MQRDERIDLTALDAPHSLNRREFVRKLAEAVAGGGLMTAAFAGCSLSSSQKAEAREAMADKLGKLQKVKLSKRLGGMTVARICMCQDSNPDLVGPSLDAGINFIHKASYWGEVPPEVKKLPRESFYCDITVDNTSPGHDPTNYDEAYNQVVNQLDRTGLKYFDIFRAHYGWHSLNSFNNGDNASYRAFQRLKREGKVKYFGVSQHSKPEDYESYPVMLDALTKSGLVDTIQMWLSYATDPDTLAAVERAHKAGIAITAMKANAHGRGKMSRDAAKMAELKSPGMPGRAALRYVLGYKGADGKPIIDLAVSSLQNFSQFEENVGAVATQVTRLDGFDALA